MVIERGSDVQELLDLQSGRAKLVLAVHEDSAITQVKQLAGLKVATEFPTITRAYFKKQKIDVDVVLVGGACEATPHLGIADAIIDLSSSGTTLRTNRLRVIDEVLVTSTWLIANRESLKTKKEKIDEIHLALESVIRARGQCYLMMNVKRDFPRHGAACAAGALRANGHGRSLVRRSRCRPRGGERGTGVHAHQPAEACRGKGYPRHGHPTDDPLILMKIFPAVDILGGKCVQLVQGKRESATAYGDPLSCATRWLERGCNGPPCREP